MTSSGPSKPNSRAHEIRTPRQETAAVEIRGEESVVESGRGADVLLAGPGVAKAGPLDVAPPSGLLVAAAGSRPPRCGSELGQLAQGSRGTRPAPSDRGGLLGRRGRQPGSDAAAGDSGDDDCARRLSRAAHRQWAGEAFIVEPETDDPGRAPAVGARCAVDRALGTAITGRSSLRAEGLTGVAVVARPLAVDARADVTVDPSRANPRFDLVGTRQDLEGALRSPRARQPVRQRVRGAATRRSVVHHARSAGGGGAERLALGGGALGEGALVRWAAIGNLSDVHVRAVDSRETAS
jgi:hypothetical protein